MKYLKWFVAVAVVCLLGLWAYSKWIPYKKIHPLQLIPDDAIYLLETDEPLDKWDYFSQSTFWTFLKGHPSMRALTEDANYLDSLIHEHRSLLKHFGDHHLMISAHLLGEQDYEFLFAFDLKEASHLKLNDLPLQRILGKEDFKVSTQVFRKHKITVIHDLEDNDRLYLAQVKNYLLCSYDLSILHSSLNLAEANQWEKHAAFQIVYDRVPRKGLAQIYLNYSKLDELLGIYMGPQPLVSQLGYQLGYSAWDAQLSEDELEMKGFTSLESEHADYSRLLQTYGNSKATFQEVISNRVGLLQSIQLKDIAGFYQALLRMREQNAVDLSSYNALKNQVEKVLKLSLEEDLISWMGSELVLAQLPVNEEDGLVLAIKTKSLKLAEEKLERIQKQIKKRSPAKFRQLEHRGHRIHFLQLKGWFKVLFGHRFKGLDRPYYTVLGDYVLFSNAPETLKACIDDHMDEHILANDVLFMQEFKQLPRKTCLFSMARGPQALAFIKSRTTDELADNEPYIRYFKQCVLVYQADDQGFDNLMRVQFGKE